MRNEGNFAAFPRPASEDTTQGTQPDGNKTEPAFEGLTKLEYFALHLMAARVGSDAAAYRRKDSGSLAEFAANEAQVACGLAEALLDELHEPDVTAVRGTPRRVDAETYKALIWAADKLMEVPGGHSHVIDILRAVARGEE